MANEVSQEQMIIALKEAMRLLKSGNTTSGPKTLKEALSSKKKMSKGGMSKKKMMKGGYAKKK